MADASTGGSVPQSGRVINKSVTAPAPPTATGSGEVSPQMIMAVRQKAIRRVWLGVVLLVVGAGITLSTYNSAAHNPNGGTYTVMWGLMLVGALMIFRAGRVLYGISRMR